MFCCTDMTDAQDQDLIAYGPPNRLPAGRFLNEIDSEFFIKSQEDSGKSRYLANNYCPFCGLVISRGLWNAEKKK